MPSTLQLWKRLQPLPLGERLFSVAVSLRAPYFRTIAATVSEMTAGRSVVRAPNWWGVHNHIGTFHAIAACNLAEFAMGMLAEATVPPTHRWLPRAMTVDYLRKATTSLTARAELPFIPVFGSEPLNVEVPVDITDVHGATVIRAVITIYVTSKV